jgi:hypothetical protein
MRECYFADHGAPGPCRWRPDGKPDRCHLIEAQRLRIASLPDDDPRLTVDGCRYHHGQLDLKFWRLRIKDYPQGVWDYAEEHGLEWFGYRQGFLVVRRSNRPEEEHGTERAARADAGEAGTG